jgi:hypothetical protein
MSRAEFRSSISKSARFRTEPGLPVSGRTWPTRRTCAWGTPHRPVDRSGGLLAEPVRTLAASSPRSRRLHGRSLRRPLRPVGGLPDLLEGQAAPRLTWNPARSPRGFRSLGRIAHSGDMDRPHNSRRWLASDASAWTFGDDQHGHGRSSVLRHDSAEPLARPLPELGVEPYTTILSSRRYRVPAGSRSVGIMRWATSAARQNAIDARSGSRIMATSCRELLASDTVLPKLA